jgi:hypothetical protein
MLKKIVLILLSINLLAAKPIIANTSQEKQGMSFAETAAWCAFGAGAITATVMFAPVVVPATIAGAQGAAAAGAAVATQAAATGAAIVAQTTVAGTVIQGAATAVVAKAVVAGAAIKGAATAVAAKAAAAPIVAQANMVIFAGQMTKKLVYQSPEEKLKALKNEEALELANAKLELQNCINQHKTSGDINALGIPTACDELAMLFYMLAENKSA